MIPRPLVSTLFPYTTLFRSGAFVELESGIEGLIHISEMSWTRKISHPSKVLQVGQSVEVVVLNVDPGHRRISLGLKQVIDRKSTRLNSSHVAISYAVFCLKK